MTRLLLVASLLLSVASAHAAPELHAEIPTQYGWAKRIVGPNGKSQHIVRMGGATGRGKGTFATVTVRNGVPGYERLSHLRTEYGTTELVRSEDKLEQKVKIGTKLYTVEETAKGTHVFIDAAGGRHDGAVRDGNALITPAGRSRSLVVDGTSQDVVTQPQQIYDRIKGRWRPGTLYQLVKYENRAFTYTVVQPFETPYGTAQLVEHEGKLEQHVKAGKSSFTVAQRPDGHLTYTDAAGTVSPRVPREGTSFILPEGTTRTLVVGGRKQEVLVQKDQRWDGTRYLPSFQTVTLDEHGEVQHRMLEPLTTSYGMAELVEKNGELLQRIKVGKQQLVAEEQKDGRVVIRDSSGKTHTGAVRIDGALLTPEGPAQRVETTKGPRDVLMAPATDAWGNPNGAPVLSTVRFENGAFSFAPVESIQTRYGDSRPVVRNGRLEHELDIQGKSYTVVRRGGGMRFVDGKGEDYRDTFAETIKLQPGLTKTPVKSPLARGKLPSLKTGPIATILDAGGSPTEHMSKETYTELRNAMIETMKKFDPRTHYFIGLGSDPHPIIAFLDNLGGRKLAVNFPASGKYGNGLDPKVLDPYVRRLIPAEVLNGSKTLVFLDQTTSSAGREGTLAQITRVFEAYLQSVGSKAKVKKLAYSPYAHPDDTTVIDTNKYPEVGQFLSHPYEHVVSQYDRHVLGSDSPSSLIERPQYNQFRKAMSERMKRDSVLDKFLTELNRK